MYEIELAFSDIVAASRNLDNGDALFSGILEGLDDKERPSL